MENNLHLVPAIVIDLAEKLTNSADKNENELMNYQLRLEAIRDFCAKVVTTHLCKQPVKKPSTRRTR
jgi:hypothetical protein